MTGERLRADEAKHLLVIGLGLTGAALVRYAASRGWSCTVVEDEPERDAVVARRPLVEDLGATVVGSPAATELEELVAAADLVVPSPGVPVHHPVYELARSTSTPVLSEIELAAQSATVPIVAITGTNGKTTVTNLVASILAASEMRVATAGNIGRPLVEVVSEDIDVVVAEVSSFQLQHTEIFRPTVAAVLNLSRDHLDWHPSFEHYRDAKARIFANQRGDDTVVLNADDPVVSAMAATAPGRVVYFSASETPAGFHVGSGAVRMPDGRSIVATRELVRTHAHDLANAAAAAAVASAAGAGLEAVAAGLRHFQGLPHRLALVGEAGGVSYYDDSKATNPHATAAAVSGFDDVVLIAGGRIKGVPLDALADVADHIRAVVAMGEAAAEVEAVFARHCPVYRAHSMRDAVERSSRLAEPGDAVLLSPACASFDAYPDYAARGEDFTREVRRLLAETGDDD